MAQEIINTILNLLPEITLALTLLIISVFISVNKAQRFFRHVFTAGLILSLSASVSALLAPNKLLFSGLFVVDNFSSFLKILLTASAILLFLVFRKREFSQMEYLSILLMLLGSFCSVSSANIYFTFTSVELVTISIYFLLIGNTVSALKFFSYSALFSGIFLYGLTIVHGLGGSPDYIVIGKYFSSNEINPLVLSLGIVMVITGLGFKMGLFPFNFIMPTVSEKISFKNLSFISVLSVTSVAAVITRFLLTVFYDSNSFNTISGEIQLLQIIKWQNLLIIISTASILAGSLIILWQNKLNKIFTFLILIQSGYILLSLCSFDKPAAPAVILSLLQFTIFTAGIIFVFNIINHNKKTFIVDDLKGMGVKHPLFSAGFLILLLSSAGIPLTTGFIAKLYAITIIFNSGYVLAGIIVTFSTLPYLYFIYKLAATLFSGTSFGIEIKTELTDKLILLILLFITLFFGIISTPLIEFSVYVSNLLLL